MNGQYLQPLRSATAGMVFIHSHFCLAEREPAPLLSGLQATLARPQYHVLSLTATGVDV